ncbi:DEAD/DEAH box helicase family protein [Fluviibacter phosphoraccumulans]|uniref:DEAD/DEAH box helicase family protein n=1 Tax=Fluviibacter phosphoraccumulans TaxID=1751046 RepID=UPI0024E1D703|nr:DEAD/DEAH box helicase family protein [Fluviibacter phosphoraccumulans]
MLMQDIKSLNFEPLRPNYPELANMGGYAEHYAWSDAESALVKLRNFAERMVDVIYMRLRLPQAPQSTFVDLLKNDSFRMVADPLVQDKLHLMRRLGNRAAHGEDVTVSDALRCLREAWQLARWLHVSQLQGQVADFIDFVEPQQGGIDGRAEIKRIAKKLEEDNAIKEARIREMLEELQALRDNEQILWAQISASNQPLPAAQLEDISNAALAATKQLHFSEDNTRKWLIDRDLRMAGWAVGHNGANTPLVGQEVEVLYQGTQSGLGYADYVLWDDNGKPLAVVEAKKAIVSATQGQQQAKDYSDGLEKMHGQRPMIFYTNGHDIWLWDDAGGYPPRKLYGFFSKDTLQYRIGFQRREQRDLLTLTPDANIAGRLYQIETQRRVQERFAARHRKALVVQATGTGKTRVAISLAKLLIEARWAKRVLFLCDRRELRKQAKNAFNDFLKEPLYVIGQKNDVAKQDARIYIGIYQGLINDYETFDVGFFDLIIADESHRSVYNLYGDIFRYFDALQVGLTATPVEMVSRSTCQLFGCDYKTPTANYTLEQAVAQGNLVPYRIVAHTTKFLRDGIKAAHLNDEQISQLEDQGVDPNTLDFDAEEIDKAIFNKDTNRVILRNLMERGIRDADGQLPGKSIIFARNIDHARLLHGLFDEMYPQFAGKFCAVIHSKEPRAEQLIDDFKGGENCKNDQLRIAISVDMLDTGIDVPEVVNLVFAKPVKSKVKFWQMIGRGTRLCHNLFGAGQHKTEFLIFDHWANFAYHEMNADEVEPAAAKPLTQRRFEARLELARLALKRTELDAFASLTTLLKQDADALEDGSIAIRDNWQAVQLARDAAALDQFAPATVQVLTDNVAPLLNALDARGQGDALRWDLLLAKAQEAALAKPGQENPLKHEILALLDRLPANLSQVRAKAAALKEIRSDAFWQDANFTKLEAKRIELREIVHLAEQPPSPPPMPTPVLDVKEDVAEYRVEEIQSKVKSIDARIYQQKVEATLRQLFGSDPVLTKIRNGEPVSEAELEQLNSLIHTHNPNVDLHTLAEFYADTAVPLAQILRSLVGMDGAAVESRFTAFAQKHPLTSTQLRFLDMLKEHIALVGSIRLEQLFQAPFTRIHDEGITGVFNLDGQLDELIGIVRSFGEPASLENTNS